MQVLRLLGQRVTVDADPANLDAAAATAWRSVGFDVVPIDGLATSAMYGGALRCGLKVLARE